MLPIKPKMPMTTLTQSKPRRNDPCFCGSGKKYKHCCFDNTSRDGLSAVTPTALLIRAVAAHQAGDVDTAAQLYRDILEIVPHHADALHLLGLIDFHNGDKIAAIARIEAAILQSRADPRYFYNLGTVLSASGRPHDAAIQFRIAVEMNPADALAHANLAAVLAETRQLGPAITSFQAALAIAPHDANAWAMLSAALMEDGQGEEAKVCLDRACDLNPTNSNALANIGLATRKLGDSEQAAAWLARAIEIDGNNAKAFFNLGSLLVTKQFSDDPDFPVACNRRAVELNPDHAQAHDNLLMAMQYSSSSSPAELFAQHCHFGRHFEGPLVAQWLPHPNESDPERRLRIGYVSADLYNHAVATFIEPTLAGHDAKAFEVFCYYNDIKSDAVSVRLQSLCDHWVPCATLSDDQLAARICADRIDILIDLSGHTAGNRLMTFARKPAPVQCSWIGYPGTSGLQAMDYYLADRFYLPFGVCDDQFAEKIVRLPASCVFLPYASAPGIEPLPAATARKLTFGSFNQPHKFNQPTLEYWRRLLQAVPDSSLLFAALQGGEIRNELTSFFEAGGVARTRLQFHDRCSMDTYLALHHQVDICLDTAPYSGGTTNLHAAWMGVPTLTLAGRTAAGRQGCVLNGHLGLDRFTAADGDDFVDKGIALANDLPTLAALRPTMRERMIRSALVQPAMVVAGLEAAFRVMWRRWCANLPPESFDAVR